MREHPRHALPVGHAIGGYKVVKVVGQGGFGIVYEATNPDTTQRVAVKEFYPSAIATRYDGTIVVNNQRDTDLYASVLERFRSTALLQFRFKHPNILPVLDYIGSANTGYMIMDYVEGLSLRGFLQRYDGHVPSDRMFRDIFQPITEAIGYIHTWRNGYLHRDISPENIMIAESGTPILIDFGALKRDLRASDIYSSVIFMREDFSPPEQVERSADRPEGFYTDIFALAGTMYFALAGHPPVRVTSRVLNATGDPYVSISQCSKIPCPPAILDAIDRGLRLPFRERPQSIAEFLAELDWRDALAAPAETPAPAASPQPGRLAPAGDYAVVISLTDAELHTDIAPAAPPPPPEPVDLVGPPPIVRSSDIAHALPVQPPAKRPPWGGYAAAALVILLVAGIFWLSSSPSPPVSPSPPPSFPRSAPASPAPTQTQRTAPLQNASFIFRDSDHLSLSRSDLLPLTNEQLRYARNEIYARKGYTFTNDLAAYFNQFAWYQDIQKKKGEPILNEVEWNNVQLILSVEQERRR